MISNSHVLTTARYCTKGETVATIKVLLGGHNIENESSGTRVTVNAITDDPKFDPTTYLNDYSILTLAQPVTFTDKVSPACLPSDGTQDYAGQEATVIGWGNKEDGSRPSVLQEANVTVITNKECQSDWSAYPGHVSEYA